MFMVLSGVITGCPLSGSLFVLVMDPLLYLFRSHLSTTMIRACADDIGAAVPHLRALVTLNRIFTQIQDAANLTLKPSKCIIVLSTCEASEDMKAAVREWLLEHIPSWANFKVQNTAKYLGLWLGPGSAPLQWEAPIKKFHAKCVLIKLADLPLKLALGRFSSQAVTVL